MSTLYSALVYPQTAPGAAYTRPAVPSSFVSLAYTSPSWNPFSAKAADRTEYWEDTAGTLALDDVLLALYGLSGVQAQQIAALSASCDAAIASGYTSSALGSAYTYPSTVIDQMNMDASVIASLLPGLASTWTTAFKVQNAAGTWAFVDHTAAQIQQAGQDGKAAILGYRQKLASLEVQIAAAATVAAVQAVVW